MMVHRRLDTPQSVYTKLPVPVKLRSGQLFILWVVHIMAFGFKLLIINCLYDGLMWF